MPDIDFSIDLHTHPTYNALGRSLTANAGNQSSRLKNSYNKISADLIVQNHFSK